MTALLSKDFFTATFGKNLELILYLFAFRCSDGSPNISHTSPRTHLHTWRLGGCKVFFGDTLKNCSEFVFGKKYQFTVSQEHISKMEQLLLESECQVKVLDETRKWNSSFTFKSVLL